MQLNRRRKESATVAVALYIIVALGAFQVWSMLSHRSDAFAAVGIMNVDQK